MAQAPTQVRCPQCGNSVQARIEPLVDVARDPASKARLLSGSLNHFVCPICRNEGQLATPLVYHDASKELLLTFVPPQIGLGKDDQERMVGQIINQVIDHLPQEARRGYLLQPQAVLTMQGLVERILEADGITREEIEAQRSRLSLFERLLQAGQEDLAAFVAEHDQQLDELFFQLASLSLQTTREAPAKERAAARLDEALRLSSLGKTVVAKEEALKSVAEQLAALGDQVTRQSLLKLILEAKDEDHLEAYVRLTRPALDYSFFQELSDQIESSPDSDRERLVALRTSLLAMTDEIDKAQQARVAESASILRTIVEAQDLDEALRAALPYVDELFLGILQANLRAARERKDPAGEARLREIDERLQALIAESLPPSLKLAQQVLQLEQEDQAVSLLRQSSSDIDEQLLEAFAITSERLRHGGDGKGAARMQRLHQVALELLQKRQQSG